uniref:Alternative protein ARMCX4 n=1 Tax=Homo sapiens TaxID=9606 RepID=L8EAW9_HUMAN|nr:alternative protein ARMCX4 [Homo sapiens]
MPGIRAEAIPMLWLRWGMGQTCCPVHSLSLWPVFRLIPCLMAKLRSGAMSIPCLRKELGWI